MVVCAGYLQEAALKKAAIEYPRDPLRLHRRLSPDRSTTGNTLSNVAGIAFKEEQAGYSGRLRRRHGRLYQAGLLRRRRRHQSRLLPVRLRLSSRAPTPRLLEKGVTVDMNYSWQYGSNFSASTELQTMINGWYVNGTEIVFACGGSMFQSIVGRRLRQ